jgi:hypothetical protein
LSRDPTSRRFFRVGAIWKAGADKINRLQRVVNATVSWISGIQPVSGRAGRNRRDDRFSAQSAMARWFRGRFGCSVTEWRADPRQQMRIAAGRW